VLALNAESVTVERPNGKKVDVGRSTWTYDDEGYQTFDDALRIGAVSQLPQRLRAGFGNSDRTISGVSA